MTPPVALITAGSAGLGAATARLFARNGIRVVVNYNNNAERAQTLVSELSAASTVSPSDANRTDFTAIRADLARRDDIVRLVDETVVTMGRLDIVFSNGGWTEIRGFKGLEENCVEDDWDRCFNVNVKSHLWLMHAAKKHLEETEGVFITSASLAGVTPSGSSLVSPPRSSGMRTWKQRGRVLGGLALMRFGRHIPSPRRPKYTSSRAWPSSPRRRSE